MKQSFRSWRWSLASSVGTTLVVGMTVAVGSMLASGMAVAQQSVASGNGNSPKAPSPSNAQIDAGEPRADTSSPSSGGSTNSARSSDSSDGSGRSTAGAAEGATAASNVHGTARQPAPRAAGAKGAGATDHVDLGMATVTGDREQPKVMYIVPWKQSDIGNLSGKPMNSLLDEALAPVDRDEFKREVAYYGAVKAPQNGASNTSSKQGEK